RQSSAVAACSGIHRRSLWHLAAAATLPAPPQSRCSMSSLSLPALRGLLLASALLLAVVPSVAQAQSRRTAAAIEALNQRMAAAETRWREALVKIGNSDPAGL